MSDFIDLSKFTKKDKIGQGAFGKVYKVMENSSRNIYVAKISRTKFVQYDQSLITDLKSEISIISQLDHPSVLNHKYSPVILTELLPNGSLADILQLERNSSSVDRYEKAHQYIWDSFSHVISPFIQYYTSGLKAGQYP